MPEEVFFKSYDGEEIYLKYWPLTTARGVIQLAHGLGETADYYNEFSVAANENGYAVYILEARGHGKTAGDIFSSGYKGGDVGENGLVKLRDDQHFLTQLIKKDHPLLPVFFLGHSMGSVVARLYALEYGAELSGLILTGAGSSSPQTDYLLKIVEQEIKEKGAKTSSKETFEAIFPNFNAQFEPASTPLDWITSDRAMIEASLKLPYTYILFNNQFYYDYFQALKQVGKEQNFARLPKALPIFLLSGDRDVATDNGKITVAQFETLKRVGIEDVQYKLYKNLRHSILREVTRKEVFADILGWSQAHI